MIPQTSPERPRRHRRSRIEINPAVYTTNSFCDSHEISRTTLYRL